ncbi:MAG: DNA polymerase III subunit alpha [Candidatus Omnitrophota bacterium]
MPHSDFIHLHNHTQYSLLDGACKISDIVSLAKKNGMDALSITDHGNLFGAVEFYNEALNQGIKPIIGCEVYIAPESRFKKTSISIQEASHHFILLAKNEEGYGNLMKLVSFGYLEGFYYRPRIDKEILAAYSKGLIGLSSCLKGEIPCLIQQNQIKEAYKVADEFSKTLGKGNFYLELQENMIPEQKLVNEALIKASKDLNLPLVATNDIHYLYKNEAKAHEALLCIQTQSTLDDPNHMRFQTDEFYFKSPEEMKHLFKDVPQAITNTLEIAKKCNLELDFTKSHLPRYDPPDNLSKEEYLKKLCLLGITKRYKEVTPLIESRLNHELKIIEKTGFSSYFLIVWDFIRYAKENSIPVGPGRGSAAGSLVSYILGITDIDPLRYNLIFERFLNPERISMPDIDIDFCYERRPEVIEYVTEKYGKDSVAQIITFGTMQARAAIRDVGRVMGISYPEVDRIAKLVPFDSNIRLRDALRSESELRNLYDNDERIKELIDTALSLEGLTRHASVHAAGVVIADIPLTNYVPLCKVGEGQITTGYPMEALEKIGLLKMDFLGLRTLTVISETVKLIKKIHGVDLDIRNIPLDDAKTYKLLAKAETMGVFQLESSGMRDLLKKLVPSKFEDLIALLALYRPGPIGSGMLDDFMKRKHAQVPIIYDHPSLEPILKETYGILVFQEQVMRIASELAGFSLSQADLLRRAMSKKTPEVMETQRKEFIIGCLNKKIDRRIAEKIFALVEFFSGYGFNKSHSAAYAVISYRTAYLKANYPTEFMSALLTSEKDNTDKIVEYVNEANRMGIKILPPDINESMANFSIVKDKVIRFGLIAIKNVGRGAIESILKERASEKFKSLYDFCERVDLRLVNHKVLESLIKCGAFDSFGLYRAQLMSILDSALDMAASIQKERSSGQLSFFDQRGANQTFVNRLQEIPKINEWPKLQVLSFEKEILGFYVTGHPLARYEVEIKRFTNASVVDLVNHKEGEEISIGGLLSAIKQVTTRDKNERMAILKLEDLGGSTEVLVFPKVFQKVSHYLKPHSVVLIKGKLSLKEESPKIISNNLLPIEYAFKSISSIYIDMPNPKDSLLMMLKDKLLTSPGKVPVYLHIPSATSRRIQIIVGEDFYIQPTKELITSLEDLLGGSVLTFKW